MVVPAVLDQIGVDGRTPRPHQYMIVIDSQPYPTIAEAAKAFGVSTRAVRDYINKEIIPAPPTVTYGLREIDIFPDEYLADAKVRLAKYRASRRRARKDGSGGKR